MIKFSQRKEVEKMKKFLVLSTIAIFLGLGSIAYAVGNQEEGLAVKNWKGEYVGSVRHVLTDSSTGNIVFAILSLGEGGEKEIVVPVRSFSSYDYENGYLVLNLSKEMLATAPEFHVSDLKDPAFVDRVYQFFGVAPSWKDGTTEGERGL